MNSHWILSALISSKSDSVKKTEGFVSSHRISDFPCYLPTSENEEAGKIISTLKISVRFEFLSKVLENYFFIVFFLIIDFLYSINLILFLRLVFWEHISVNHTGEFILCDYVCECEWLGYIYFIIFSFQRADPFKMHWFTVPCCRKV